MGVAFYGILSDVEAKCERAGGALRASLDVVIVGERGPAAGKADGLDVQYFVAVTGADQAILSKRSFAVHIAIPADAKRAGVTDHIEETIPLAGQASRRSQHRARFSAKPRNRRLLPALPRPIIAVCRI